MVPWSLVPHGTPGTPMQAAPSIPTSIPIRPREGLDGNRRRSQGTPAFGRKTAGGNDLVEVLKLYKQWEAMKAELRPQWCRENGAHNYVFLRASKASTPANRPSPVPWPKSPSPPYPSAPWLLP